MVSLNEELLPLAVAVERVTGDRPTNTTCWRWTARGVQAPNGDRIYLEFAKYGGRRRTSVQAVRRFIEAQTAAASGAPMPIGQTPRARAASVSAAERELAAAGI